MPRGDKTGPMGMGSRTGRGAGGCDVTDARRERTDRCFTDFGGGFGRGCGKMGGKMGGRMGGRMRGHRFMQNAGYMPQHAGFKNFGNAYETDNSNEKEMLEGKVKFHEEQLKRLNERLSEIEEKDE